MLKCLVIINPSSGKIRYKEYLPELTKVLTHKFNEIEFVYTEKKGDGIHYGRTINADTVIVVGGDGTIREVVNGLMQQKYIPKLGIIPAGTVNDLARALNIPLDPFKAIAVLKNDTVKYIDVGKLNETYFISLVAIGGIPQAIHDVQSESKTKWGRAAYFFNGAKYAMKQQPFTYEMKSDNHSMSGESSLVVLSLLNSVAGMGRFFQDARPDDGRFRIMVFPTFKFLKAGYYVARILAGKIQENKEVAIYSTKEVSLILSKPYSLNVDGEKEQGRELHIQVIPKILPVYSSQ